MTDVTQADYEFADKVRHLPSERRKFIAELAANHRTQSAGQGDVEYHHEQAMTKLRDELNELSPDNFSVQSAGGVSIDTEPSDGLMARLKDARECRDATDAYDDHRLQWAIRVDELQQELIQSQQAQLDAMREALVEYDKACDDLGGCSDGHCTVSKTKGMHTNGGCNCYGSRGMMRLFTARTSYFKERVRQALKRDKG